MGGYRKAIPEVKDLLQADENPKHAILSDSSIHILDEDLIESQKVTEDQFQQMIPIYQEIDNILLEMGNLSVRFSSDRLNELYQDWLSLQFKLQKLWNFPENANYFRDYDLPHCTCPKFDNDERLGTPYRIISSDCVYYHGKKA